MQTVENGKFVSVNYKGMLKNGDIFDTTEGDQPMEIQVGTGQVIKGFENALMGMCVNEKKVFIINPEDAYGHRDENNMHSVPRKDVPKDMDFKEGDFIGIQTPGGAQIPARISTYNEEKIVLDLNHPLADEVLTFEIEVVGISDVPTRIPDDCSAGCECASTYH